MIILFWLSVFLIVYTFIGYGVLLYILVLFKRMFFKSKQPQFSFDQLPSCTLIIAAYNEQDFIEEKIRNSMQLKYPSDKLQIIIVTDGSTDKTPEIVSAYPDIKLLHSNERKGKIAAVHRAVLQVTTELIVFTDANTFLNEDALVNLCRHYADDSAGAVAGEKRVQIDQSSDATAGEGIYWKYESKLKQWDSELNSVVGAAGELFSIRTALYEPVASNSLLDDFMISMRIAEKGYKIVYEPQAYALETTSANLKEELKRKLRISAGGIQSIIWLKLLLNPFKFPLLSFQYISHRVLRWTITPVLLLLALFLNILIVAFQPSLLYKVTLVAQIAFYLFAFAGWMLESRKLRIKLLFVPYYFCFMNYAVLGGIYKYYSGRQSVIWDKAERRK